MKLKLTKDPSHKGYYVDEEGNLYVFRFGGRPIKVDSYRDDKPRENVQVEEVNVEKSEVIDHTKAATKEENNKFIDEAEKEENQLKEWIDGQNSDGFEQQEFAETYFDPYSGDGPFTRYEAEEEISRRIDVSDYIDESEKEAGVDNYIEENGLEYTEDEDIRWGYRAEIENDPFAYISEDAIYEARDLAARDNPDYDVEEWYNMSSIRSYSDFEVEELIPEIKKEPNKLSYTSQELKDKYGTDDVDLINAGKPSEERVTKQPEYVYDKGDYSSLAVKDKKYEILEESESVFGTHLYKLKDEEGNIFYKPKSEVYNKSEKETNLTLMNRYSGTISTLQELHPEWSMTKIMDKIRKLEE